MKTSFLLIVVFLLFFHSAAFPIEVQRTVVGTLFRKSDTGIEQGEYGYIFAPTLIRSGSSVTAWFCGGLPTFDQRGGGDHIFRNQNWGSAEVTLCPTWDNTSVETPLCAGLYRGPYDPSARDDRSLICDPAVVRARGEYWMYYTGDADYPGNEGQMFLAKSADGRSWTKNPSNSGPAQAVIPFGPDPNAAWGIGEPSVVFKDDRFHMYYTYFPTLTVSNIYHAVSSDGKTFDNHEPMFSSAMLPFANEGIGGVDVKFVPGWNLWFAILPTFSKQDLVWNVSRDGIHWLPWDGPFGYQTRTIALPRRFAIGPSLEGDEFGWIGTGSLDQQKQVRLVYTAGDCDRIVDCPNEPGFWAWTFDAVDLLLITQSAVGRLENVDSSNLATGWSYDPDSGVNDTGVNGGGSFALNFDTLVRPVAFGFFTGRRSEGPWQGAQIRRDDLVTNGYTPDPLHGFSFDLNRQNLPEGRRRIVVEAGEFPTGMGATQIQGEFIVDIVPPDSRSYQATLQCYLGHFVSADGGGGGRVRCDASPGTPSAVFKLVDRNGGALESGDDVNFQASNGMFVVAEGGGGGIVNADREDPSWWELFRIWRSDQYGNILGGLIFSGDHIVIKSILDNFTYFMVAEGGGGDVVNCNRTQSAAWESFRLQLY